MTSLRIALVLGIVLTPSVAGAQLLPAHSSTLPLIERDSIRPGLRVKLFVPGIAYQRSGTVRTISDSVLVFEGDRFRELVRVPLQRLDWMQVSTGRRVSVPRMLYGASLGMLAGMAVARMWDIQGPECGHGPGYSCSSSALLLGGSIGGVAGAVVGFSFRAEGWRSVRLR